MESQMFRRRNGVTDFGTLYEEYYTSYLILQWVVDSNIKDFSLSSNNKDFGAFDDIVFDVNLNGQIDQFAVQLKHNSKKKGLFSDSFVTRNGDFSLKKYFECYQNLDEDKKKYKLVLLTSRKFDGLDQIITLDGQIKIRIIEVDPPSLVLNTGRCWKFQIEENPEESAIVEEFKRFLDKFYLFSNQNNWETIKESCVGIFREFFLCEDEWFFHYINEWNLNKRQNQILTKRMVSDVIAVRLLSPHIVPFSISPVDNKKLQLLRSVISDFDVTLFDPSSEDSVKTLYGDFRSHLTDVQELNRIRRTHQLFNEYIVDVQNLSDEQCCKLLWLQKQNNMPLLIREGNPWIAKIVEWSKRKVILLALPEQRENFSCSVFSNLTDVRNEKKEDIYETFDIFLKTGETVYLSRLINQNEEVESLTTSSDLLQIANNLLILEQREYVIPQPYIERFVSRNVFTSEFLHQIPQNCRIVINNTNIVNPQNQITWNFSKKVIIVNDYKLSVEVFNSLSKKRYVSTCHLFRPTEEGYIELLATTGCTDRLEKFRVHDNYERESNIFESEVSDINLVCSHSGDGKSVLFRKLYHTVFPKNYPIIINAKDFSSYNKEDFLNSLFLREIQYCSNDFSKRYLQLMFKKKRVVLFWDEMEEYSSLGKILELIMGLRSQGYKQFLSSRMKLKHGLEEKLNVLARNLKVIDDRQQRDYLKNVLNISESQVDWIMYYLGRTILKKMLSDAHHLTLICGFMLNNRDFLQNLHLTHTFEKIFHYLLHQKLIKHIVEKTNLSLSTKTENDIIKNNILHFLSNLQKFANGSWSGKKLITENFYGIFIDQDVNKNVYFVHELYREFFTYGNYSGTRRNGLHRILFMSLCQNFLR